jgi:choline dehydrogenase-like flavoprotein
MDPTQIIYGQTPFDGTWPDPPASVVSWEFHESDGIRLGTIVEPRLLLALNLLKKSPRYFRVPLNYGKLVGLFVKVKDDLSGQVSSEGSVTKPFSEEDYSRLEKGMEVATEILRALGCPPDKIVKGDIKGAHPSGTCRIGHVVNNDLETEIKNLYVCDASVFPQALDRPTVMTIIGLGKRLCQQILAPERVTATAVASTPEAS